MINLQPKHISLHSTFMTDDFVKTMVKYKNYEPKSFILRILKLLFGKLSIGINKN